MESSRLTVVAKLGAPAAGPVPARQKSRITLNLLLVLTLAACVTRLWLMALPSSFWVDEMGTAFVVGHGASDASLRAAPQVADSIYYIFPRLAEYVAGRSEVTYRLFSVFAMGGALAAIAAIAARLIDPRAAWFAVFACLAFKPFNYQAVDARPYALGTLVLCGTVLLLIRWLDSGRWRDGLYFAVAASLLWWVHLIFWPLYVLFVLYAGARVLAKETSVGRKQLLAVMSLVVLMTAPVAARSLLLLRQASAHVIVQPPVFSDLLAELKLNMLAEACTAAVLLAWCLGWKSGETRVTPAISRSSVALILGWWLIDPVSLYGFSRITGNSVFVARYMYLAIPGAMLAGLALVALTIPAEKWKGIALAAGVAVLLFEGHWGYLWPQHHGSGWKEAAAALHQWVGSAEVPVICPSPFIEAREPVWRPDYPTSGFLYSNLSFYPAAGRLYPFPFESSRRVEEYASGLSQQTLSRVKRFAIYGGDRSVNFWRSWFSGQSELKDFDNRVLGSFGDVRIVVFTRGTGNGLRSVEHYAVAGTIKPGGSSR